MTTTPNAVKSTKAVNYTAEQTTAIVAAYNAGNGVAVEKLAEQFGKTARSIVAKLSREGVYVKKTEQKENGVAGVTKEDHIATIAAFMAVDAEKLVSLGKASKSALLLVEEAFVKAAHLADNKTA